LLEGCSLPADYHINESDGLITIEINGQISLGDIRNITERLLADPGYTANLPQLIDLRGMDVTLRRGAAALFSRFMLDKFAPRTDACIAIVIDPELESDICARVYWLSCALGNSEVFDNYALSLKWLMRQEFAQSAAVGGG
jgi:hypothetical protein